MLVAWVILSLRDAGLKMDVQAPPGAHLSFGVFLWLLSEFFLFLLAKSHFSMSLPWLHSYSELSAKAPESDGLGGPGKITGLSQISLLFYKNGEIILAS